MCLDEGQRFQKPRIVQPKLVFAFDYRRRQRSMSPKWLGFQFTRALNDPIALPCFEISELLNHAHRPCDSDAFGESCFTKSEDHALTVLGEKTRTGFEPFRLVIYLNACTDRITTRLGAPQLKRDGLVRVRAVILKDSKLRSHSAFKNDVRPAIAVKVGYRESPAVVRPIKTAHAGEIEVAVTTADVQNVRLASIPTVVFADELVDCVPPVFIRSRGCGSNGRA